jgi:hypothetical protein
MMGAVHMHWPDGTSIDVLQKIVRKRAEKMSPEVSEEASDAV